MYTTELTAGLGLEDILKKIPHRPPILLIDRVLDYAPGDYIRATRWLGEKDPFFQGHFPEFPILPGVYLIEACAQSASLLLELSAGEKKLPSATRIGVLGAAKVRFLKPVFPETRIIIYGKIEWEKGETLSLAVTVTTENEEEKIMTGSLIVSKVPGDQLRKSAQ